MFLQLQLPPLGTWPVLVVPAPQGCCEEEARGGGSAGDPALEIQRSDKFSPQVVLLGLCGLGPAALPVLASYSPNGKWTGRGPAESLV